MFISSIFAANAFKTAISYFTDSVKFILTSTAGTVSTDTQATTTSDHPDTTATPDITATTLDITATPDIAATPDITATPDTSATPVKENDVEEVFSNLVENIDVASLSEEFEQLYTSYRQQRDTYYKDLVSLHFAAPSLPLLRVGNKRVVVTETPGAGDSLRGTKSIYEVLQSRKQWRQSNPNQSQPSFTEEIKQYENDFNFSLSMNSIEPELK